MTEKKSLKRKVRARMSKTGERYTAARRQTLSRADEPLQREPAAADPSTAASDGGAPSGRGGPSDETLAARTGRPWHEWREMLDASGAADRPHSEIARWLMDEHGVDAWWAQSLTVRYEKQIGRRVLGQRGRVFAATATKTIGASAERAHDAFVDEELRSGWLPDLDLTVRTASRPRGARFNVGDRGERLILGITAKGPDRCTVSIEHERLPDAATTERMKAFWRERLSELKRLLER